MNQAIQDDKTIRPRNATMFSIARTSFEAGFKRARATDWTLEQAMSEFESMIIVYVRALEELGQCSPSRASISSLICSGVIVYLHQ